MTKCLNCEKDIENPVIYKGKKRKGTASKFCRNGKKCKNEYHNRSKQTRNLVREIRELLERTGAWGYVSIAFGLILKRYHI